MKRFFTLSLLCMLLANAAYAQTDRKKLNKGIDAAVEKAVREHNANQKKTAEKARRKEREKQLRHEQQRKQHEANFNRQMNNLNSVSANDYMKGPQQKDGSNGFQATTYKAEGTPKAPVASKRKDMNNRQTNGNGGNRLGNIGAQINSGGNYTGDRYNIKPAGFGNRQHQRTQVKKSTNEYRTLYTMRQPKGTPNGRPSVTTLQRQSTTPKVSVKPLAQQKGQNVQKTQAQQHSPTQNKVAWMENGKFVLDTSKPITIKTQSSSSADLKSVDTRRIDYATEIKNITVYNIPNEAYNLSDKDNKKITANIKIANDERTEASQGQKMTQDVMSGFSSFENRKKWEDIYSYGYHKTITTSRTVTKKRK